MDNINPIYNLSDYINNFCNYLHSSKVIYSIISNVLIVCLIITVIILIIINYAEINNNIKLGIYIYVSIFMMLSIHYYGLKKLFNEKYENYSGTNLINSIYKHIPNSNNIPVFNPEVPIITEVKPIIDTTITNPASINIY